MTLHGLMVQGVPPIVAILRGLPPEHAIPIGGALIEAGLSLIEVPLNSPEPFESIRRLQRTFGDRALIGAGTVLSRTAVDSVYEAGGRLIVTPNTDPAVIRYVIARGLDCLPGFFTPSEALAAVAAGAKRLKLFPASSSSPGHMRAIREVLPPGTGIWAVGGTNAGNLAAWLAAGADGIGVGGALYRPGDDAATVAARARTLMAAWRSVTAGTAGA